MLLTEATSVGATTAYGRAAMRSELDLILNQTGLYNAARRLGQLSASYQIDKSELIQKLYQKANELKIERPQHHITRGIQHGEAKPRVVQGNSPDIGRGDWGKRRITEIQEYVEGYIGEPSCYAALNHAELRIILTLCIYGQKAHATKFDKSLRNLSEASGVGMTGLQGRQDKLAAYGVTANHSGYSTKMTSWKINTESRKASNNDRSTVTAAKQTHGPRAAVGEVLGNGFRDESSLLSPGHNAWVINGAAYKLFLLMYGAEQVALKDLPQAAGLHEDTVRSSMKFLVEIGIAELVEEDGRKKYYKLIRTSLDDSEQEEQAIPDTKTKRSKVYEQQRVNFGKWKELWKKKKEMMSATVERRLAHKKEIKKIIITNTVPKRILEETTAIIPNLRC